MKKKIFKKIFLHFYLILFSIFAIAPLALLVINGLKPKLSLMTSPFNLPSRLTLTSVREAWELADYARGYLNSFIVMFFTIIIIVIVGSMAAYALTKMSFRAADSILVILLIIVSIPMGTFLVPIFFEYINLHLIDTLRGIILVYSGIFLPFNIFLFRTYFLSIPIELNESAYMDGLNHWQVYCKIIMPIAKPVIATVATIVGLWTWNEFFFANALLQSDEIKTVATRYIAFTGNFGTDWNMISSAGLITIIPILIAYMFLQDKFVSGITEGSIKG